MRRMSRSWRILGEDYLIKPNFVTLAHRDDLTRLSKIAKHKKYSTKIRSLEFNLGEIHEYHAFRNGWSTWIDEEAWTIYQEFNKKIQKNKVKKRYCNEKMLCATLPKLRRVDSIEICLARCPFDDEGLSHIWANPSNRLLSRVATVERTTNIMRAAASLPLKRFYHDRLPFEFFSQGRSTLEEVFSCLSPKTECLDLRIDYSPSPDDFSDDECFRGLDLCLRSTPNLRTLKLQFSKVYPPPEVDMSVTQCLGQHTYPHLHTLELEGMIVNPHDLLAFCVRHASTLRYLRIGRHVAEAPRATDRGGIYLLGGTLKELLTGIKDQLSLEKLQVYGDIMDDTNFDPMVENCWYITSNKYDDEWELVTWKNWRVYEESYCYRLENFVLRDAEWPFNGRWH